jgi:hypothetical protein
MIPELGSEPWRAAPAWDLRHPSNIDAALASFRSGRSSLAHHARRIESALRQPFAVERQVHSNATPTLFWLNQTTRHLRTTRSFSVIRLNRPGRNEGFGTAIAAPSAERFSTRHLVLDPSPQIYAGSSISVRGCLRLSSIMAWNPQRGPLTRVKPCGLLFVRGQERDGACGLVGNMPTVLPREKGCLAFDAPRLALRRMFPMDGNVFNLTSKVRALKIIGSQSVHSSMPIRKFVNRTRCQSAFLCARRHGTAYAAHRWGIPR